jgi:hypothetical protein
MVMFLKDRIAPKNYLGIRNDDFHALLGLFADILKSRRALNCHPGCHPGRHM